MRDRRKQRVAQERTGTLGRAGSVYIEYFVLALVVLVATIAFYQAHLKNEDAGARGQVNQVFDTLITKMAGRR